MQRDESEIDIKDMGIRLTVEEFVKIFGASQLNPELHKRILEGLASGKIPDLKIVRENPENNQ